MRAEAIRLEGVTMRYRVPHERIHSLKEYTIRRLKRAVTYGDFVALLRREPVGRARRADRRHRPKRRRQEHVVPGDQPRPHALGGPRRGGGADRPDPGAGPGLQRRADGARERHDPGRPAGVLAQADARAPGPHRRVGRAAGLHRRADPDLLDRNGGAAGLRRGDRRGPRHPAGRRGPGRRRREVPAQVPRPHGRHHVPAARPSCSSPTRSSRSARTASACSGSTTARSCATATPRPSRRRTTSGPWARPTRSPGP